MVLVRELRLISLAVCVAFALAGVSLAATFAHATETYSCQNCQREYGSYKGTWTQLNGINYSANQVCVGIANGVQYCNPNSYKATLNIRASYGDPYVGADNAGNSQLSGSAS